MKLNLIFSSVTNKELNIYRDIVLTIFILSFASVLIKFYLFKDFPIFPDEIGYRVMSTRYFYDNHKRVTSWGACESSYAKPIPSLLKIGAVVLSSLSYIHNYVYFRYVAMGILFFGVLSIFTVGYRLRLTSPPNRKNGLWVLALVLLFVMSIQTFSQACW